MRINETNVCLWPKADLFQLGKTRSFLRPLTARSGRFICTHYLNGYLSEIRN
jgi:hypothetical protein